MLLACSLLLTCLPAPALAAEWTQTQFAAEESASEEETSAAEESASEEETSAAGESASEEEIPGAEAASSGDETATEEATPSEDAAQDAPTETTWTSVSDPTEVAQLIRDNWSDSYFQEAVVDTRRNRVTVDGEQDDFDQVFEGVTEDEAEEILTSTDTVEAYFENTAYETEVQSGGTVSVTAPYQTCRILLTAETLTEDYGAVTILEYSAYEEYVLQFATEEDTQAAYEQLAARYGEENCFVDQVITADDLFLSDGEDVTATSTTYSWGCSYMGLDTLKADATADAETVTVAIIDSGIDADHAFFEGRTITGDSYDFLAGDDEDPTELSDPYGHGTHVAGIIVECTPDNVELMVLRILDDTGNSTLALVKTAMQYALEHGADVMNLSLGVSGTYTLLDNIIQTVYDVGILVCCAAGNGSSDSVYYPANNAQTIAVSAIGSSGAFAKSYSNYGEEIDFCAPGTSIVSAASGGGTTSKSGTSMASAYVAAALTYVIAACPDASAAEQYSVLQSCVTDLGDTGWDEYYGWGCVTNLAGMFDLSGLETQVTLSQTEYTYNGTAREPEVTVQCGGLVLTQDTDYTVAYGSNVEAGTATVTVTGTGDYTGTAETTFTIAAADLSECTVTVTNAVYTGSALTPVVTVTDAEGSVFTEGTDYTVSGVENLVSVGSYPITVTGIGSCTGSAAATFTIGTADLSTYTVAVADTDAVYTGSSLTPAVTVTDEENENLTEGVDYTVSYSDNINAGVATATVTGMGNYIGTASATFTIEAADLSACTITEGSATYTGSAQAPAITAEDANGNGLAEGTDYTITYEGSMVNVGSYDVTVTGMGNYTGTSAAIFTIVAATLPDDAVSLARTGYTYDGSAKEPAVTVTDAEGSVLTEGTDYTVDYSDNINAGTVTVTVTGSGNYTGTATASFTIAKAAQTVTASLNASSVVVGKTAQITASAQGTLSYRSGNTAVATVNSSGKVTAVGAGTATITVTAAATDNYLAGRTTLTVTVQLATPALTGISNTSSGVKLTWNAVSGAAKYRVFRKTSTGWTKLGDTTSTSYTDTTVKSGAAYTYTVRCVSSDGKTFTSGYNSTGLSIKYLTAGKISSLTNTSSGITAKWNRVTGASGYYVYRKTSGGSYKKIATVKSGSTVSYTDTAVKSKNGATYVYAVRPYNGSTLGSYTGKTTARLTGICISSLKNVKTRKMTVKWKKNTKATGYQIQYSTSSSFSSYKTVTVSGYKNVSKTISKLTKGKKYYVRVRAYKTVSGTKYYSAWSSKKSVKISK